MSCSTIDQFVQLCSLHAGEGAGCRRLGGGGPAGCPPLPAAGERPPCRGAPPFPISAAVRVTVSFSFNSQGFRDFPRLWG